MAIYNSTVKQRLPSVGFAYMNCMREYVSYYPNNKRFSLSYKNQKFYIKNFDIDRMHKPNQCSIEIRLNTDYETADEIHQFNLILNSPYRASNVWINGGYTVDMTFFTGQDNTGFYFETPTETRPWKITNFKIISNS